MSEGKDQQPADAGLAPLAENYVFTMVEGPQLFLVDCQSTHGTRLSLHGQTRPVQQDIVPLDAVVQFGDVSISMREIMQALREKPPQGTRLVRCRCGVIKVRGQRCPECGE